LSIELAPGEKRFRARLSGPSPQVREHDGCRGAGTGLLLGIAASAESCTGFCEIDVGPEDVVAVAAILGGVGAGIGALIGAASHGERWQRVVEPYPAVCLRMHGGVLGMRLRF